MDHPKLQTNVAEEATIVVTNTPKTLMLWLKLQPWTGFKPLMIGFDLVPDFDLHHWFM